MTDVLATWINGQRAQFVPVDDRGLHYGDGLFETLLVRNGQPRFMEAHLARLSRDSERLDLPFDSMAALRAEIAAAATQAPPLAVLKIIVTRGSAVRRGYAPGGETARRIVSLFSTLPLGPEARQGVNLGWSELRLANNPVLAGIKHLSRLENVMAAREARTADVFDVLLRDGAERVVSGAMTNLFLLRAGQLVTPSLHTAGIAGVMRGVVLREAAGLGFGVSERAVTRADIESADEAFVTNARIGVVPVRRVGEHLFHMNQSALRIAGHVETLDA